MSPSLKTSSQENQTTDHVMAGGLVVAAVGKISAWLIVLMVTVQFSIVVFRYLLGVNFIWAQEFVLALHGMSFMLIAPWTWMKMRHVRIDVFSERFSPKFKNRADKIGFVCLLLPMTVAIFASSLGYVTEAWSVMEGSAELSGLPGRFLIKTVIPIFAVLMVVAAIAVLRSENTRVPDDHNLDMS